MENKIYETNYNARTDKSQHFLATDSNARNATTRLLDLETLLRPSPDESQKLYTASLHLAAHHNTGRGSSLYFVFKCIAYGCLNYKRYQFSLPSIGIQLKNYGYNKILRKQRMMQLTQKLQDLGLIDRVRNPNTYEYKLTTIGELAWHFVVKGNRGTTRVSVDNFPRNHELVKSRTVDNSEKLHHENHKNYTSLYIENNKDINIIEENSCSKIDQHDDFSFFYESQMQHRRNTIDRKTEEEYFSLSAKKEDTKKTNKETKYRKTDKHINVGQLENKQTSEQELSRLFDVYRITTDEMKVCARYELKKILQSAQINNRASYFASVLRTISSGGYHALHDKNALKQIQSSYARKETPINKNIPSASQHASFKKYEAPVYTYERMNAKTRSLLDDIKKQLGMIIN